MLIHVTQEDIDNGVPKNGIACPLALAIRRVVHMDVDITSRKMWIYMPETRVGIGKPNVSMPTPADMRDFIERFDHGISVYPQDFELVLPPELVNTNEQAAT